MLFYGSLILLNLGHFLHRRERVRAAGGEVGRLSIVGGAEVQGELQD